MTLSLLTDAEFNSVFDLMSSSFPKDEMRSREKQFLLLDKEEYQLWGVKDGDLLCGFFALWEFSDFIYIEHFCMLPDVRGRGCGSRALELLRARGKTIILEIDPPVDDISRRRKGFYERNGFIANGYDYTHLPYHRDCKGHRLVIMTSPRRIDEAEYNNFLDYMRRRVMVF